MNNMLNMNNSIKSLTTSNTSTNLSMGGGLTVMAATWCFLIIIFGIFANGTILLYNIFIRSKNAMKVLEIFILNSALADFLSSLIFLPMAVASMIAGSWELGDVMCQLHNCNVLAWLSVSQLSNLLIAIYCYIKCILKPTIVFSVKNGLIYSSLTWLITSIYYVPIIATDDMTPVYNKVTGTCALKAGASYKKYHDALAVLTMYIPLVASFVLYGLIFITLKIRRDSGTASGESSVGSAGAKAMAGLLFLFIVCFSPVALCRILLIRQYAWLTWITYLTLFSTFALNPFYYAFRIKSIVPVSIVRCCAHSQVTPNN